MMNEVKYSSYTADFKLKVIEGTENTATEWPAMNLLLEFKMHYWRKQKDVFIQSTNKSR
jgi:hypothetical protein